MAHRESSGQAYVPWSKLLIDVMCLAFGCLAMIVSAGIDVSFGGHHSFFARSGPVAVLMSAIVAYRSLAKHYEKIFLYPQRQKMLRTSRNQSVVDGATLFLSIVGTLAWGYGDLFVGA